MKFKQERISLMKLLHATILSTALAGQVASGFDAVLTDDTALALNSKPVNMGAYPTLRVDSTYNALFKFNLSPLPPGTTGNQVSVATLTVFIDRITKPGAVSLLSVNGVWTEAAVPTVTFTALPGSSTTVVPVLAKNTFVRFDVTTLVKSWIDGAPNYGVAIGASPSGATVVLTLDSKENIAGGHCATLEVGFVGALGPQGPAGPQGATGPQGPPGVAGWGLTGNGGTTPGVNFVGTTDNQPLEVQVNGLRALRLEPTPTSPNLIGGYTGNSVSGGASGATVAGGGESGYPNTVAASFAFLGGGSGNLASGRYATIGGGQSNTNACDGGTVAGGIYNTAGGSGYATVGGGGGNISAAAGGFTTVGGGENNNAAGGFSAVAGGMTNYARGNFSFIGGGANNRSYNDYSTVAGGQQNDAGGLRSVVGGGYENTAGDYATVTGGTLNNAVGSYSVIGGGNGNNANGGYATVSGGLMNQATGQNDTVGGGDNNTASGGRSTVAGGTQSKASGYCSTVGGGYYNIATNSSSTIGGGVGNFVGGQDATIAGGAANTNTAYVGTIGGGIVNVASGDYSTIGGGQDNLASGSSSTVSGGQQNVASGYMSTVPGGILNNASGDYSFAVGNQANAVHQGAFVWGDSTSANIYSTAANQFTVRASGGTRFFSSAGATTGVSLAPGGGSWSNLSDRDSKEHFSAADSRQVLDQVIALPISLWNYKGQARTIRHIGPVAQDFAAAFGVGEDDKHITTVDENGVALAAVQGLNSKLEEKLRERDAEIQALKNRLADLEKAVAVMTAAEAASSSRE